MNSTQWGIGRVTFVTRGHLWVLAKRAVGGLKFDHWGPFECELVHTPSAGGMREANVRLWGNKCRRLVKELSAILVPIAVRT